MEQWLRDHAGWLSTSILLVIAIFRGPVWKLLCAGWGLITRSLNISKAIHATDTDLIQGYERQKRLALDEREQESKAKEAAIRGAARQQVRILDLVEQLELKEDVNKRDRIARIIYLKHLRACGDDIDEIEREIKCEVERRVISEGLNH